MKRNQLEEELLKLKVGESIFLKFSGLPPAVRSLMFRLNKKLGVHFACVATTHGHVYQITNKGPIRTKSEQAPLNSACEVAQQRANGPAARS